jgi:hypothetical protein
MKNIVSIDTKVKCCHCFESGFFIFSYEEYTCPRCDCYLINNEDDDNGDESSYYFCKSCNIVVNIYGCVHCEDIMNAHLINEYEYKGEVYTGMPLFENEEEWKVEFKNIKILKLICPNYGSKCHSDKYDYGKCELL